MGVPDRAADRVPPHESGSSIEAIAEQALDQGRACKVIDRVGLAEAIRTIGADAEVVGLLTGQSVHDAINCYRASGLNVESDIEAAKTTIDDAIARIDRRARQRADAALPR